MDEVLVLKVQGAGGAQIVRVRAEAGVYELREVAAVALGLTGGGGCVQLLRGRPPRPLPLVGPQHQQLTLKDAGLKSGDSLIAEECSPTDNDTSTPPAFLSTATTVTTTPTPPASTAVSIPLPSSARPDYRGLLLKRVVPSDNSCLFTSIGFVMNGKVDTTLAPYMRKIIADVVANDPINYSDALLGKPNPDYCDWIQRPDSWGGAIEISVLSNLYGLEIDVVNVMNALVNRFGEDKDYGQRVFLLFDGIHYDPLFSEKDGEIQTIFPIEDEDILEDAEQLAKSSQPYTDVDNFQTKCLVCGVILIGQKNANQHAMETNHNMFDEI